MYPRVCSFNYDLYAVENVYYAISNEFNKIQGYNEICVLIVHELLGNTEQNNNIILLLTNNIMHMAIVVNYNLPKLLLLNYC